MLVYLDQNHVSRIAKHLRGQPGHDAFGALYAALRARRPLLPASGFHVLETRGGYLLPTLQGLFAEFAEFARPSGTEATGDAAGSGGERTPVPWVRPWQEVVARQIRRGRAARDDLLAPGGDWSRAAVLEPLADLDALTLPAAPAALRELAGRFGLEPARAAALPFFRLLARMLAFRSGDAGRAPHRGDAVDLIAAAVLAPYVDVYGTDRYAAELLRRVGGADLPPGGAHSGRRSGVEELRRAVLAGARRTGMLGA